VDPVARLVIDTGAFQRLRFIKQLGHAHPGATHTRFDHAVGVYHLARRALRVLGERGELDAVDPVDCRVMPLAALLHDIGHYPFSHALEELAAQRIPGHHEALVGRFLQIEEVAAAVAEVAPDAPARIEALIRGVSRSPLQGLVSGSLDLDKIEYLKRDAFFCGVPYGEVDVDRLLHALALLPDPNTGQVEIGVQEKGLAALESLLFAKYQMFRNVYWHHAVRAATVLYKRVVSDALDAGLVNGEDLVGATDEGLMHTLAERAAAGGTAHSRSVASGVAALRGRRLPKRAAELSAGELPQESGGAEWLCTDSPLKRRVEDRLADDLGYSAGEIFLDFPDKPAMFGLDLLLRRRSGEVIRLGPEGYVGLIGLPRVASELYRSARMLRMYSVGRRCEVPRAALARLAAMREADVSQLLDTPVSLLRQD
jgi:uncharacterized protein